MRRSIFKAAIAVVLLAGCSTPDPTVFRPGFGQGGAFSEDGGVAADASSDATVPSDGASGDAVAMTDAMHDGEPANDGGPSDAVTGAHDGNGEGGGGGDGGGEGGSVNAFTGAPPYVATTGTSTLNASHNFNGTQNPVGQACLDCHTTGGPGVEFLIGGTVWKDVGATIPAPQAQVVLRDNANVTSSTYTDANGNFYILKAGTTFTPPAHPGVRDATHTSLMVGAINNGNCNSCHKTGGQTPINVP